MSGTTMATGDMEAPCTAPGTDAARRRVPLRMFGKKFNSKRLLASSRVWMHTIPTSDCDIVVMLPANTSDSALLWLLARLRARCPHLALTFRHHAHSQLYGLHITAAYPSLLQAAEELGLVKPVRAEFGGGVKEFVLDDQDCFVGVADEASFLSSQERQSAVRHFLHDLRATQGEEVVGVTFLQGQPIVPRLMSKRVVLNVFPLHSRADLLRLRQTWVMSFLQPQPLDEIGDYFGVKIGLYFGYLGHYTQWLVLPAVAGVCMWLLQGTSQWVEDVSWVAFGVFNVVWATLYLVSWRRRGATLAYTWGTLDRKDDLLKDPRPLFKGDLRKSAVTGQLEPHYPAWRRSVFRYGVSVPVVAACLAVVFCVMLLIFQLQEWVNAQVAAATLPSALRFGPKVLLAVAITLMDEVYKQVAVWLNNKENHRLEETHETNLVIKLVLFQFVNSFLALFYIAFYLRDMDRLQEMLAALLITRQLLGNIKEVLLPLLRWKGRLYSMGYKMAGEMSSQTLDREVEKLAQVCRRRLVPASSPQLAAPSAVGEEGEEGEAGPSQPPDQRESPDEDVGPDSDDSSSQHTAALTQAEVESAMPVYDDAFEDHLEMTMQFGYVTPCVYLCMCQYDDAFEDHLEMTMQFGYVTLFSSAFPLAAACALINNLIEIRSDAFKLCYTHQRPFGTRADSIGIWQNVLEGMVVVAIIVNSALIGMGDLVHRMVPGLSDMATIVVIVAVEHAILLVKLFLEYVIPAVPHQVALQMARVEYQRRQALKRLQLQGASVVEKAARSPGLDSPVLSPHDPDPCPDLDSTPAPRKAASWFVDIQSSSVGHSPSDVTTNPP